MAFSKSMNPGYWMQIRKLSSMTLSELPPCQYIASKYNGADYEIVKTSRSTNVSPSQGPLYRKPLLIHEGRGQWLWDHEGRRYLDMFGGIVTVSVGHCHPKVVSAATDQLSKLGHTTSLYMHPRLHEYVEKLTSKLPRDLKVVYFVNSGSEATELAFLMARAHTGSQDIISLKNSYHGGTYGSTAATAISSWRYPISQPSGYIHVMNPDVYRGFWGGSNCRDSPIPPGDRQCECAKNVCVASEKYFAEFESVFEYSLPNNGQIAAFIAESIQGVGGVVQYPKTYLRKVYDLVRKKGGVCIADEVQTGFARTGEHFWGFEGHGVQPDIVTMAKGIGNGYPLGAVATTTEIAGSLKKALHFNTFGGNPVACAVGSAVLDVIDEENLQENALSVGTYFLHRLSTLRVDHPTAVGDVRGKGLMIGVELIDNAVTKAPLKQEYVTEILEDAKDMRVLIGRGGLHNNVLRIKPPMCVTKEDVNFAFEVIKKAIERYQDRRLRDKESVFCSGI